MSEALAWIMLATILLAEGMALGYGLSGNFPERPLPYRIVSLAVEIAAVWLALRVVLGA